MEREVARRLADDLWLLDTLYQGEPGIIGSYLLTGPAGAALIDVGSGATVEQLLASLRATGTEPTEVRHIVLTHIHLDHAGAAGLLLRDCPEAMVYVHPSGAPHLSDPSRLLQSAERIYGARMRDLWGEIVPVPQERIRVLEDGAEIPVGQRRLRALHTPGHAIHHIAYYDAVSGEAFVGDVAGVRLEGIETVRPPTPPPDLMLEDWYASLDRLLALEPKALYLAHYGTVRNARSHLEALRERLGLWGAHMLDGMNRGLSEDELTNALAELSAEDLAQVLADPSEISDELRLRYELAANHRMSAQGYVRYYRKHHPEMLVG